MLCFCSQFLRLSEEIPVEILRLGKCSCVMVISIGQAPSAFTLDQNIGDFVLTNESLSIPKEGKIYSINEGNSSLWDGPTAKYASTL